MNSTEHSFLSCQKNQDKIIIQTYVSEALKCGRVRRFGNDANKLKTACTKKSKADQGAGCHSVQNSASSRLLRAVIKIKISYYFSMALRPVVGP